MDFVVILFVYMTPIIIIIFGAHLFSLLTRLLHAVERIADRLDQLDRQ